MVLVPPEHQDSITPANLFGQFDTPLAALVDVNDRLKSATPPTPLFPRDDLADWRGRDYVHRAVNFMIYDLSARTAQSPEEDTFAVFNDFFFGTKGFRVQSSPYLLDEVLQVKQGAPITLALLYIHIGMCLGLKLQLVNWPLHAVVRWVINDRTRYIDLDQRGKILTEDEMVAVINRHRDQARTLSMPEAVVQYLAYVAMGYRQSRDMDRVVAALDLILEIEPNNMRFLLERALAKKEAGRPKDALIDFKRYFSFVDLANVNPDLRSQYEELLQC